MHNCGSIMHRFEFLTHTLEIHESSWCTHIFKATDIVDGYLAHQRNKIGKVQNTKLCLPNYLPVRDAEWFKCHFQQLYSKADLLGIHFLSKLSLPFYTFVFTSAENMSLLPGLHMQRSARQQCPMKILLMREREVLKQLKKDPSTTIVASGHLTGAIAVGSVMRLNFGRDEHGLPHFYYCSVAKWMLQFHSDPLFSLVQW